MKAPTLTEITEAVTAAVRKNSGTPIALVPDNARDDLHIGTVVWRRSSDWRPITHTYIYNSSDSSAFLEHGDYYIEPQLDDRDATRRAALRAFPDLARAAHTKEESIDPRDMPPHVLATRLMESDPDTLKQGYSKENAILAAIHFHELDEHAAANLRHDLSDGVLSLYEINRSYGGPEEGGWWFDEYEHLVTLSNPKPMWELAKILSALPQPSSTRFSTNGGPDREILIEDAPRSLQTTSTPHYE